MGIFTFKGGIHPNDGKSLAKDKAIVSILPTGDLVYPLSQHIGAPAQALVKPKDKVKKGQVIGIIEAMKLMNEIEAGEDGIVEEILVENEQLVEFGQPLVKLRK